MRLPPRGAPASAAIDWIALTLGLLAGLVLFLLGVEQLSRAFSAISGERLRRWLARSTRSAATGVLTGAVVCIALDSSSATIVMVIAMIRGGVLSFEQSLGVVMGANIGTTIGAQIIALDVFGYAPLFLAAGFVVRLVARSPGQEAIGTGVLGAGLVFFGLGHLQKSVLPLREHEAFLGWIEALGDAPLEGALTGAAATVVLQSSSAMVGIAIVMAKAGILGVPAGVALMLGAEIGTVSSTLVASLGRGRDALRCALFHFAFNGLTVAAGLALIGPLIAAAEWFAPGTPGEVARVIANAQVVFNVVGVAVFLPLVPLAARALRRVVPERPAGDGPGGPG